MRRRPCRCSWPRPTFARRALGCLWRGFGSRGTFRHEVACAEFAQCVAATGKELFCQSRGSTVLFRFCRRGRVWAVMLSCAEEVDANVLWGSGHGWLPSKR